MMSVITVNYKSLDYLERMLTSLFAYHKESEVEVIVIENGSGDDVSSLEQKFSSVKWVKNTENKGFAGAVNQGLKQATGDSIILINPDVEFISDSLIKLGEYMASQPEVGIGGIHLLNEDRSTQASVRAFPAIFDQLMLLLKIPHIFPAILNKWYRVDFDYAKTQDVDQVMGAFFGINRSLIQQIGPFDEGFFMWYEEVDYCKRAKEAGWSVKYIADIEAIHAKGVSAAKVPTYKKQSMVRKSVRYYMSKHHGLFAYILFLLLEPVFYLASIIASIIKPR